MASDGAMVKSMGAVAASTKPDTKGDFNAKVI